MFVRFRQSVHKLQLSIVETRRAAGKVRHEHIASLGSVVAPPGIADRIAFWSKLHDRLARLANRIDTETQGKILGQVHDRIPMPTVDEVRHLQLENAEADERFWSQLQDMHESSAADEVGLRDRAEKAIAEHNAGAENAKRGAAAAKERIERLKKGGAVVGGLGRPVSVREQLKAAGLTESHLRHCEDMAVLTRLLCGDDKSAIAEFIRQFAKDRVEAQNRADRRYVRKLRRRLEILSRLDERTRNVVLERLAVAGGAGGSTGEEG